MTIISGPDHTIFPFPAPWTTVILYTDLPLKTPINSQDPACLPLTLSQSNMLMFYTVFVPTLEFYRLHI